MKGRSSTTGRVVTVFGATGFLGRYLVNKLGQAGTQVVVPFRGEAYDMMHLKPMGDLGQIVPLRFNIRDEASLRECIKHADIVINLIAQDRTSRNYDIAEVNVETPLRIARICAEGGTTRFIHTSHIQALPTSMSAFMRAKWQAEDALRRHFPGTVIARPAVLFGHEDRFLNLMGGMAALPFGYPVLDTGRAERHPVYVGDVAGALARMCQAKDIEGGTFDLFGPDKLTMKQVHQLFMHNTLRHKRLLSLPPRLFWLYTKLYPEWRYSICPYDAVIQMREDEVPNPLHSTFSTLGMKGLRALRHSMLEYVRPFRSLEDFGVMTENLPELKLTEGRDGSVGGSDVAAKTKDAA